MLDSVQRHTSRAVVIHDNKLLLIERWRQGKHYFSIPGGGIEDGETPEQTVIREILEETGCTVTLGRKLYVYTGKEGSEHHIFLCEYVSGEPHLPADSPEARARNPDNRFEPTWLPLADLATTPFLIWRPVADQLIHDLKHGFSEQTVSLPTTNVIP